MCIPLVLEGVILEVLLYVYMCIYAIYVVCINVCNYWVASVSTWVSAHMHVCICACMRMCVRHAYVCLFILSFFYFQSRPSMFGCLSQLVVNARILNLMSPDQSEGTLGCPSAVSNVASFSGNGYVQLMDSWTPGEHFTVTLSFRTTTCFGILFYLANTDEFVRDYISLELIDGRVSQPICRAVCTNALVCDWYVCVYFGIFF